ncbi:MAG: methionyl-tRNA formyltransferase [Candidatus Yanofskybacteria bacterium CG10_big_fil_rev_8_21_14_0_10_36_16]|uniref:Methionyl-tRNA formyltransferase n=1 Tax=Candidatus Yanofskybacteria bacterium CG10_big_fil_rev_8_21_14_0_10_36_16 TaxID=1975096 RepID=A0A2J0Q792_9BACT|nr:MAG: methionyl-tRNA formyltransferase [Candidatus Yanofskybacteria bacterium CG10_big_fil_rev_8_21_14_0_10_36_16]
MDKSNIKLIFFGTNEFAVPVLEALVKEGYDIVGVITEPNKPVGRNQTLTPPPVKLKAQNEKLKVFQPKNKLEIKNLISELPASTDVGVVVYYGKIIPQEMVDFPKRGLLNIHPSLLPKYRGASPIQTAILNGDVETGVTIMKIDDLMDHGEIITSVDYQVSSKDYHFKIYEDLTELGTKLLIKILPEYLSEGIKLIPQKHDKATYTKKFKLEDGEIKPDDKAKDAYNKIRAFNPEPGAYWKLSNNKILKILEATLDLETNINKTGLTRINKNPLSSTQGRPALALKGGVLILDKVKPESKKAMSGKDFMNGHAQLFK